MSVMTKRIIMSISGVVLCGMSVGMFKHAALGVDPFQALMSGLAAVIPVRFGMMTEDAIWSAPTQKAVSVLKAF